MKKVEGHDLYKNDSGAIVVTDKKKYESAKKKKLEKERLNKLEEKMDKIEYLLEKLLNK